MEVSPRHTVAFWSKDRSTKDHENATGGIERQAEVDNNVVNSMFTPKREDRGRGDEHERSLHSTCHTSFDVKYCYCCSSCVFGMPSVRGVAFSTSSLRAAASVGRRPIRIFGYNYILLY